MTGRELGMQRWRLWMPWLLLLMGCATSAPLPITPGHEACLDLGNGWYVVEGKHWNRYCEEAPHPKMKQDFQCLISHEEDAPIPPDGFTWNHLVAQQCRTDPSPTCFTCWDRGPRRRLADYPGFPWETPRPNALPAVRDTPSFLTALLPPNGSSSGHGPARDQRQQREQWSYAVLLILVLAGVGWLAWRCWKNRPW